jgi:hypothetical protein
MGTDRGYAVGKWLPICQWDSAAGGAPVYRLRLQASRLFQASRLAGSPALEWFREENKPKVTNLLTTTNHPLRPPR